MNQVVAINDAAQELAPLTATEIQTQVNVIQQVMEQVMKKDVHYGVIPGTQEPTLYKPGAEKILTTFRLAVDPDVEDLSNDDEIRYRIKVRLSSFDGRFVGAGVGECSSNEEKYKWRRTYIEQEFEETDMSMRREKWVKPYNKPAQKLKQIRTNPADLANTILKMAKKRALVDATLTATAASDCFTQDLEDLPSEVVKDIAQTRKPNGNGNAQPSKDAQPIIDALRKTAEGGWLKLQEHWGTQLTNEQRQLVGPAFGEIKKIAEVADETAK